MTEPQLSPCPFCGKDAIIERDSDHHGEFFTLGCNDNECPGTSPFYTLPIDSLQRCVSQWNNRPIESDKESDNYRMKILLINIEATARKWAVSNGGDTPLALIAKMVRDGIGMTIEEVDDRIRQVNWANGVRGAGSL